MSILKKTIVMAALLASPLITGAQAQSYPERPVTMIVPYTPGGATDIIGRVIAQGLGRELGQSVVVENISGAAGSVGAGQAARADADGYTLLMGALTSHSINMSLPPAPGFDLIEDFETVALAGSVGLGLITRTDLGAETVGELLEMARAAPGDMTYASAGLGSPQHLGMEMLKSVAGIDVVHIPYQGSSPALADIVGGHVDFMIDTIPSILSSVENGSVTILGVTTPEPSPFLEGVATVASSGLEGYEVQSWFGVLAPAGTPDDILDLLNEAINNVLTDPETIAAFERQGVVPAPGTRDDQAELIASEIAKWSAVIEEAGPME